MRQNPHVRICGGPGSARTLVYPITQGADGTGLAVEAADLGEDGLTLVGIVARVVDQTSDGFPCVGKTIGLDHVLQEVDLCGFQLHGLAHGILHRYPQRDYKRLIPASPRRCCMKTRCGWRRGPRFSDFPQEPHYGCVAGRYHSGSPVLGLMESPTDG